MPAIYIVTLLVLIGFDALSSKVHAGSIRSSGSSDSSDSSKSSNSRDDDEQNCGKTKQVAIEKKIKYLNDKKQPLPTCTCGTSGTISKIDIFNENSRKTTTLFTCSGCTGSHVLVTSSAECKNVPDIFRSDLEDFCLIVHPRCKNVTVYRCGSPAPLSTTSFTETPRPVTSTPLKTTTNVASPPATTQSNPPVITITPTPFQVPGYGGYGN